MTYGLDWCKKSEKQLLSLENHIAKRIVAKLQGIKTAPYQFLEKMSEEDAWKLRVGDYRVLIDIDENKKLLKILKVGHRKNIYG